MVEVFGHLQTLSSGQKTVPRVVPSGPGRCQTRPPHHLGKRERSARSRCAFGCCCAQGTPGAWVFGVLTGACAGLLHSCAHSQAAGEPISRYTLLQAPSLGQQPEIQGVSSSFPWLWCHARGPRAGAEPPLSLLPYSNIAEALVSKGLATVIRYRQDDDQRSSHYDELLAAEAR